MPVTPTYPGVYIEEVPSEVRTITGVATSITAFVGYTARGPVNKAVRLFNMGDYKRNFGGLHHDSLVSYAVQQFFLNGGTDAYVVRAAKGAAAATVTLGDTAAPSNAVLQVSAANEGAWGNYVRLDVDYNTSNPDSTFNLTVRRYEKQNGKFALAETEQYRNLSMNSRSPTYAPNVAKSASKLISLKRKAGLSFSRGYSLSGNLSTFPSLSTGDTTITGVLNGNKPFTLTMTSVPTSIAGLKTAVDAAINNAGLSSYLKAGRANFDGTDNTSGDFLKLTSQQVTGETSTDDEHSSVEIFKATSNDAAAKLKLGLNHGGREFAGASPRRPAPTGTTSGDLADVMGNTITGGTPWTITIEDHSSGSPVTIVTQSVTLPNAKVGTELRNELQKAIRGISNTAAQNAEVELAGNYLRIVSSADTPSVTIKLIGTDATMLKLPSTAGPTLNVQQYSLGSGASVGAQTGAGLGSDGAPPTGSEYLGSYNDKTGIYALRDVDLFNLMLIPGTTRLSSSEAKSVLSAAISFCEDRRAFFLVDYDPQKSFADIDDWVSGIDASKNAAVFFPQVKVADPLDGYRLTNKPPSGMVAGVMARTDSERGVWKAPAGTDAVMRGAQGLVYTLTDRENGVLNQLGINCLRSFPVYGKVVWGARTLKGADRLASEWKYIPVRRTALFIEESLYRGTQWVVFEPNDEPLWAQIRLNVGAFMHNLFRQGAFQGTKPRDAYFVKCDKETTTQNDIDRGIVNILVGFAPLKPAEFVIIKISQIAGQVQT